MSQNEKLHNFQDFLAAVKSADLAKGITEAACHHSAVEVKDWDKISAELRSTVEKNNPSTHSA